MIVSGNVSLGSAEPLQSFLMKSTPVNSTMFSFYISKCFVKNVCARMSSVGESIGGGTEHNYGRSLVPVSSTAYTSFENTNVSVNK